MLHKIRGIVIKYIKYGDTSIIVNIFTEAFGLQTYIVNGARSKKSKGKIALYQPTQQLHSVAKKIGLFLENGLLLIRSSFFFYELMPDYQPIRKKRKDCSKKHF